MAAGQRLLQCSGDEACMEGRNAHVLCSLVSREVDLKACAELMAGCRDVAPTEQSLDSTVRSIGHEAQERSSSLIQRNFWTLPTILPTILNESLDGTIRVQ